ncbi:radical SAM/SPASM domain-containing protein [Brachyspira pilosicoli]|uniref:radical SAM/SPASM domain-containing protein n=1 Tax=Brachyspira pilosicoli TaxID=52584 RepID=UPI0025432554|nr:radical SAM/SPASM domain-containing protein [Brachyspira pilosicoli]WIH87729.1 SPASM domain-containing protein [Brachyspira pilosicoli]
MLRDENLKKLIDDTVWWIPFRKKRNAIREKLINGIEEYNTKTLDNTDKKIDTNLLFDIFNRVLELTTVVKDINIQKDILKKNLFLIEIEIASYCNRTCYFCPNSIIDRRSNTIELPENIYLKILDNLKDINYSGMLSFHRFNEPLANRDLILKRVKQARDIVPNAILQIFTNGDYLTRDYLDELRDAGINFIMMSYYGQKDEKFDIENNIKPAIYKMSKKLDLDYIVVNEGIGEYAVKFLYDKINVIYRSKDFEQIGSDRGGVINIDNIKKVEVRDYPCYYPFGDIYIDYNGLVMPCCNMRSDVKTHEPFILGDINKTNLFELFTNENFVNIRRYLASRSKKSGPCEHCHYDARDRVENWINS